MLLVLRRGWCWNCKSNLEEPENGTDPFEPPSHERRMYPMPARPSQCRDHQGASQTRRGTLRRMKDHPMQKGLLPRAPGGPGPYGVPCGAMHDGSHVHHLGVDPRLAYGMSTAKAVSESGQCPYIPGVGFQRAVPAVPSFPRASMGPAYPPGVYIGAIPEAPPGVSSSSHPPNISIATPRKKRVIGVWMVDQESSDGSSDEGPRMPAGNPPESWLLDGETEDNVYKIKHLRNISVTKLPTHATSCREWRAALLASVSRIDLTARDVLVEVYYALRGCWARSDFQGYAPERPVVHSVQQTHRRRAHQAGHPLDQHGFGP